MTQMIYIILVSISLLGQMNFAPTIDYSTMSIMIKGKVVSLKTGKPLKKALICLDKNEMYRDYSCQVELDIDSDKSKNNGDFSIDTYIDKNAPQLWLKVNEFAQLNIVFHNLDTTGLSDTIDLGTIYLVPYDNELEVEAYNMPDLKKEEKAKYERYAISQLDSLFKLPNTDYGMELNPIDTITGLITRYNFGPNAPRGTTVEHFKKVTFKRVVR